MKGLPFLEHIKALPLGSYRVEIRRYLLLLLIPLLLLIVLYINVNQVITRQTEDYARLMVDHFYVQSASMLQEMRLVGSSILHDSDVAQLLREEDDENMDSLYICDVIRDKLADSPYVQHAYLICQKNGNIYSDQGLFGGNSLSTILKKIGADASELISQATRDDLHILSKSGMAPYCIIPIWEEDGEDLGCLIVTLRMMEFLHIFYSLDAELCTIFNDKIYISSYINAIGIEGFNWRDEQSVSALLGKPVTCVYAEHEGYTYLVAVARENYTRPLHVIIKWFFIYATAALVLSYLYLYQISKRRYQRIAAMVDALPLTYAGDQSYEHIYENIRSSLEDYRSQREHLQAESREHSLHMLLTGGRKQGLTAEQFQNAGVDCQRGFYYVVTFFAAGTPEAPGLVPGVPDDRGTSGFLHMLLRSTINELAEQYQLPHAFCGIPEVGTAVLYGDQAETLRENVLAMSRNVIEILTHSYTMDIQATISNPVSSVLSLPDAFQETQELHSFARSINSSASVIAREDLQHKSGVLLNGDFLRQEQILINTLLLRKYEVIPAMVDSLLSTHVSALRKNYALAQSRLQSVANVLLEGVRMASLPGPSATEDAKAIAQADSVRQLTEVTRQIYERMAAQCREAAGETDPVSVACGYIAQNLSDQNLNVALICEAAGVSVQRLTRMFQTQFNMAVAEYVNDCRIKKAKELLPNRQLTVSQIAQQVGYSNTDTFTRNFKKIEGITASEYRKTLPER